MKSFFLLILSKRYRWKVEKGSKICLPNIWMPPYASFYEEFWGILEKPQNYRPHPNLDFWGCLRIIYQKPQICFPILSLKNPQNFWNIYPQPQKASNFEAETEDPRILRSGLTALYCTSVLHKTKTIPNSCQ